MSCPSQSSTGRWRRQAVTLSIDTDNTSSSDKILYSVSLSCAALLLSSRAIRPWETTHSSLVCLAYTIRSLSVSSVRPKFDMACGLDFLASSYVDMRYPLISAMIYAYCSFLSPAFHHLWLTAGSANSNFFYAITLVWALGGGMLVLDSMWAWGRERWEKERPPIRPRSASQLTVFSSKNTEAIAERVEIQPQEPRKRVVIQV